MSYWLFTINDTDEVFSKRIKKKSWPIFDRTQHRRSIRPGDKVIFYKAGKDGKKFIGEAKVASEAEKTSSLVYSVKLKNVEVWKKGVEIRNMLQELVFIGNQSIWGNYLQGGVTRITERDHGTIVSGSKK